MNRHRIIVSLVLTVLMAASAGCSGFTSRPWFGGGDTRGYWMPLTVNLNLDPSVTTAGLSYRDACQKSQVLAFGEPLTKSVTREVGMAFEHVQDGSKPAKTQPDGTVQVSLGLKELQLIIPRQETNTYSANVVLGGTATYLDETGAVLYSKSLRTEAKGMVETERDSCKVSGLDAVVAQAATALAQGFKSSLGTATPIRQAAASKKEGVRPPPMANVPAGSAPHTPAETSAPPSPGSSPGPVTLAFRAMLRDENQDHVLDGSEQVTVDVEVSNRGTETAQGVKVALKGTPVLIQMLQNPILVGDLKPGESKHVTVSGSLPSVTAVQQAELIISVEASGGLTNPLRPKKFLVALRPAKPEAVEVLSVDVDQIPALVRNYERKKAVGIAIGVGSYRDRDMPGVKFAARDAEIMTKYFRAVSGVPAKGSRVLTDEHALKDDLAETFEEWLPQHVEPGSMVFIFFAGRAVVDPLTGAVSLIPHEGNVGTPLRSYSLRRLHQALAALPIQQAVLMLDVTLMVPPGTVLPDGHAGGVDPIWGTPDVADGKLVQMIGVSRTQLTHQYEQGKHGLFSYFLLKGLGGEADRDKNGVVVAGELFEYAQRKVAMTAKADFGNEQEPACVPALVPTSKAWNLPVARLK